MTATTITKSGTLVRKAIWFQTTKTGKRQAFFWSHLSLRAIRMPLAEAELLVATGQANDIGQHPMRPGK